jgi:hypothetical protein
MHHTWGAIAGQKKCSGLARVSNAYMAQAIYDVVVVEDTVGIDKLIDKIGLK